MFPPFSSGHEACTDRTDSIRRDSVPEEAAVCGLRGQPEDRQALANRRGDGCQPHWWELENFSHLSFTCHHPPPPVSNITWGWNFPSTFPLGGVYSASNVSLIFSEVNLSYAFSPTVQTESSCANIVSAAPCQADVHQYETQFSRLRTFLLGECCRVSLDVSLLCARTHSGILTNNMME